MFDAMIDRAERAEEMGITLDQLDRYSRYLEANNPYEEEEEATDCPGYGDDCIACPADCIHRI